MPIQMKRLSGPDNFASADTEEDLYTVPRNTGYTTTTVIKEIILCNTAASAATVTLWLKPKNVTVATDHVFINALSLAANETVTLSTSLILTNDDNTDIINGYEEY